VRTRPLREVGIREVRPLLEEEAASWQSELGWDFSEVRAAVAAGIERGTLPGRVLDADRSAQAYCYYMVDTGRVIVGSIYAARAARGLGLEDVLVEAVLRDARAEKGGDRVECQTLFCSSRTVDGCFSRAGFAARARHYMRRELTEPPPQQRPLPDGLCLRPLRRDELQTAAEIIYRSHHGSVDAALNLTYSTPQACRSFVDTLVLRSGCGRFDPEASRIAAGPRGAEGVLIASRLAARNGHVCQVSVLPQTQSRGVGAALMTAALHAFRGQGLDTATLSVTVANARAHRLYEQLGFSVHRAFAAHAWVRPPAQIELPA
jgi:ribosomal protein S18 acetylase RimI-like enzyme